eukprot:Em0009g1012a
MAQNGGGVAQREGNEEGRAEKEAEYWREKKKLELVQSYQERKNREKEEEEHRKQEEEDKSRATEAAFRVWAEKKTESLRAQQKQEKWNRGFCKRPNRLIRLKPGFLIAQAAFEAWKKKKEESVLEVERLGPDAGPLHERAWCPARSITHSYPSAEKASKNSRQSQSGKVSHSPSAQSSRGSRSCNSSHSESNQSSTSSFSRPPRAVSSPMPSSSNRGTARKKTIQVCCQTLNIGALAKMISMIKCYILLCTKCKEL